MLLVTNRIDIDPGLILLIIIFSLWGLSCIIALCIYLYKRFKKKKKFTEEIDKYENPYSEL